MQGRDKQAERKNIVYWGKVGAGVAAPYDEINNCVPRGSQTVCIFNSGGQRGEGRRCGGLGIHRTSILEVGFQSKISTDNYGGKGHPNQGVGLDMHPN